MLAEKTEELKFHGEAFNFGNETPVSVLDLVHKILKLTGKTLLVPTVLNEATYEIREQYLDCSKAKRMLHWQPKYTIEDGLRETIEWYNKYLEQNVGRESDLFE